MSSHAKAIAEAIREVAPKFAQGAREHEQTRCIAPELYDELVKTGFFMSLYPTDRGGYDLSMAEVNDMIIEGARHDGSLGWLMMIGATAPLALSRFSQEALDEVCADITDLRVRGTLAPQGTAVPVDDGFVVSGRWAFASGGPGPHVVLAQCIVRRDTPPVPGVMPEMLVALLNPSEVTFEDTWDVMGMKATDSRHIRLDDVLVPRRFTTNVFTASSCFDTMPCRAPLRPALGTAHAAVAIGIAQGALDDIMALSATKRSAVDPTARLAANPMLQHVLGEQTMRLHGARALLDQTLNTLSKATAANRPLTPIEILGVRATATAVTADCVKIVDSAYTLGGSASLYNTSPLQRRLRDIHVATQHAAVSVENFRTLGAFLAGEAVSPVALL